ncbi:MAG: MBL fold metallo-hydrolase, partial [Mesobacillus sp.]|uniref:MBL fold metallo-hydrolase n=1 Tax=Mesobacillus sp. TaxID=2675271 RepID=UPI003C525377
AKAVYGEKFTELFDPILEIPEDRLIIKGDGDTLAIGEKLTLQFFDTPGHANHHFSIHHPATNGIFSGDTAGIYYPQIHREDIEFYLPSTSPNQFDPEKMLQSMTKYKELGIERIYFGHYGMSDNPAEAFKQVEYWLGIFLAEAKKVVSTCEGTANQVEVITKRLFDKIKDYLTNQGLAVNHPIFELLYLDINVSSMGLVHYLEKDLGGSR